MLLWTCSQLMLAVYHLRCYVRFSSKLPHTPQKRKRGRPANEAAQVAFDMLCTELEHECENEMYTLNELHAMMHSMAGSEHASDVYGKDYLKQLLQERYATHIYFASRPGRDDVVGFSSFCDLLLHNKYFSDRIEGEGSQSERLVKKAAGLVKAEIRETFYGREFYPTDQDFSGDCLNVVPPLLTMFIKELITSPVKQAAIGQSIVQTARPQGCIMPLLLGVGLDLDGCGVQELHIKLSRLGFSLTVEEITRYKHSVMQSHTNVDDVYAGMDPIPDSSTDVNVLKQERVIHFVADNVDHNVRTLDGLNTFHGMGIISTAVCPDSNGKFVEMNGLVRRIAKPLKAAEATQNRCVPVLTFNMTNCLGIGTIKLCEIDSLKQSVNIQSVLYINDLWAVSDLVSPRKQLRPSWSGFMQTVLTGPHIGISDVEMLSIVDLNPSDTDCIYSTLVYVIDQAKKLRISTPDIIFDQPLYIKAVDIAQKGNLDIVIRLGGFHMLMSFLGSIGHLMKGSGLEDVMGLLFGPNTVEHILNGKAYARAVRGHFLVYKALSDLLLDYLKCQKSLEELGDDNVILQSVSLLNTNQLLRSLTPSIVSSLNELYTKVLENGFSCDDDMLRKDTSLVKASQLLHDLKSALSVQSRTARLWLYYMKCVETVKLFLLTERTGDWLLHLHIVHEMLPVFAATGHVNYAKSARLYLQQMHELSTTHPFMYNNFLNGNHTVRRSDRFWSGLSMDLVIGQTMMRAIKCRGGLTRGRGFHESVRIMWLSTMTNCAAIRSALSKFVGLDKTVSEHVEMGASRMRRDVQDFHKVKTFLTVYSPFKFMDEAHLISISSGVVAGLEDGVDCDKAEEIGNKVQRQWDQMSFADITLKKSDQIKTMAHLTNTCSIESDQVNIDPNTLFHRLIIAGERFDSLRDCFHYELTPYPMSLFKAGLMRKPDKGRLYKDFAKGMTDAAKPHELTYVIDGGFLLHKVRWSPTMQVSDVLPLFLKYITSLGILVSVVFDGYEAGPSIKDQEHTRRSLKAGQVAPDRQLTKEIKNTGNQEAFLSNVNNKMALINLLTDYLQQHGITIHQATGDADTLIVSVALQNASASDNLAPVAVIAEDTDILALLLYHRKHYMKDISLYASQKRAGW